MTTPKDEKGAEPAAWQFVYEGRQTLFTQEDAARRHADYYRMDGLDGKVEPLYATPPGELDSARDALTELERELAEWRWASPEATEANYLQARDRIKYAHERLSAALSNLKGTEK